MDIVTCKIKGQEVVAMFYQEEFAYMKIGYLLHNDERISNGCHPRAIDTAKIPPMLKIVIDEFKGKLGFKKSWRVSEINKKPNLAYFGVTDLVIEENPTNALIFKLAGFNFEE